jgi:hypothetical protein
MLSRVIEAGVPFAQFSADEIYGQPKYLQGVTRERGAGPTALDASAVALIK